MEQPAAIDAALGQFGQLVDELDPSCAVGRRELQSSGHRADSRRRERLTVKVKPLYAHAFRSHGGRQSTRCSSTLCRPRKWLITGRKATSNVPSTAAN